MIILVVAAVAVLFFFIGREVEAASWRRTGDQPALQKKSRGRGYWVVSQEADPYLVRDVGNILKSTTDKVIYLRTQRPRRTK